MYVYCVKIFAYIECYSDCSRRGSDLVAIIERMDMGLYEGPLSMSLLGFGMGTVLANFHMCGIMLLLRAVLNMFQEGLCVLGA